jgi:uncharacterized protein with PQ loop repeat
MTDTFGYIGGVLLSIQLFPQIYKVIQTKSSNDLSFQFMGLNIMGLGCMSVYGILNNDTPLYVPAMISLTNTIVLFGCAWYFQSNRTII